MPTGLCGRKTHRRTQIPPGVGCKRRAKRRKRQLSAAVVKDVDVVTRKGVDGARKTAPPNSHTTRISNPSTPERRENHCPSTRPTVVPTRRTTPPISISYSFPGGPIQVFTPSKGDKTIRYQTTGAPPIDVIALMRENDARNPLVFIAVSSDF